MGGVLASCGTKEKKEQPLPVEPTPDVSTIAGQRDSLMTLIGEISENLLEVNRMENILVKRDGSETPDQRQELTANIAALRMELENRRKALDELEKKLKNSNGYTANLKKTIDSQKQLIEEQSLKIQQLQSELNSANEKIAGLSENVDSLSTQVSQVSAERDSETMRAEAIADEMNICYYVTGSNKELKEHKILEKKFLGKTKIMEGDYDRSYFTKADKRTLGSVNTFSKKAKLMTTHPAGSYKLETVDGVVHLKITDSKKFWEKSNFLVIQTD